MDPEKLKLKYVTYFMEKFVISAGGKELDIPRIQIATFQVSKQYEIEIYPFYYVVVNVPLWLYDEMINNKDSISVTMDLKYFLSDDPEKAMQGQGVFLSEYKGKYKACIPYTSQVTDPTSEDQYKQLEKSADSVNKGYAFNEYILVEMALYNESYYNASFKKMTGCNIASNGTDIMTYILNKGNLNNILAVKADGGMGLIHDQETITQNLLTQADRYGLHSEGSIIFFDLDCGYILPKRQKCEAWRDDEHKAVYIYSGGELSETLSRFSGIHIDGEKKFTVLAVEKHAIKTEKVDDTPVFKEQAVGNEFVTFSTSNALFNILTPNKEFIVSIDTPKAKDINGKYRLYSVECNMTPRGEYLEPSFVVRLRR